MALTETFKNICGRKTHISLVTATKYIQENHFIDAIFNDNTSTTITSANISETLELLNNMQEFETWKERHFDNTELDTEVSVLFFVFFEHTMIQLPSVTNFV